MLRFDNKYAVQLQADYFSLVDNINDASQKISTWVLTDLFGLLCDRSS